MLHNVIENFKAKMPEVAGFVSTVIGLIFGMDLIGIINGLLQSIVLIGSIAVSVITFLYIRDKRKKIKEEEIKSRGNGRSQH